MKEEGVLCHVGASRVSMKNGGRVVVVSCVNDVVDVVVIVETIEVVVAVASAVGAGG